MYFKLEENKILKVKNNKKTKILLRLEPFFVEEMPLSETEVEKFDIIFDIDKLESLSKDQVVEMFKNYILNSYDMFIQIVGKRIMNLERLKSNLFDLNFDFDNFAVGCLFYGSEKEFAVKKDDKWYEFSDEYGPESFSRYKEYAIDKMFNMCSKDDFIKMFTSEKFLYLNLKINEMQNKILKFEEEKMRLQNCNFEFML
jgi:hypothetical protein